MTCPDLAALRRAGTPRSDPAVVEHLHACEECWLDWQIQQGARLLHDRESETAREMSEADRRVLTRIVALARESDIFTNWKQLALSALLIAVAVLAFLMLRDASYPIPIGSAVAYAVAGGICWALYRWRRERKAARESPEDLPAS